MYEIHGIAFSSNTTKVVYVAEALGVPYKYIEMNLKEGEHKTAEHLNRHPFGKVPTLTVDGESIFESGAICRYLANAAKSDLYPAEPLMRAQTDQWLDFFSVHLGKWLTTVLFERVLRSKWGLGETDKAIEAEAQKFAEGQLQSLNSHLEGRTFLTGDKVTIADIFAFAYLETTEMSAVSLDAYPRVAAWYEKGKLSEAVVRAKATTLKPSA